VSSGAPAWTAVVTKAVVTLLFAAAGAYVAYRVLAVLVGPLLVVAALIGCYRIALGIRHGRW
jgi:hypothetical protein